MAMTGVIHVMRMDGSGGRADGKALRVDRGWDGSHDGPAGQLAAAIPIVDVWDGDFK
jgi:hypothetical protein